MLQQEDEDDENDGSCECSSSLSLSLFDGFGCEVGRSLGELGRRGVVT